MLSKLIKHEFFATWKVLLLLDGILLFLGVAGFFVMGSMQSLDAIEGERAASFFVSGYVLWFLLYFLSIFAVNVGTVIFLTVRYYRSLYSAEGYLSFTLPVEPSALLHAKLVCGYLWILAGLLLTILSVVLMGGGFLIQLAPYERRELLEGVRGFFGAFADGGTVALLVLSMLISPLCALLSIYFCITVGQLWQKHRIGGAVLCFVALRIAGRVVMSTTSIGRMVSTITGRNSDFMNFSFSRYYNGSLGIALLWYGICSVIFYAVIRYINARKVNLD